jgi:hypothetical protein
MVKRNFLRDGSQCLVIFDGYSEPSTKDSTHRRRYDKRMSAEVSMDDLCICRLRREDFLSIKRNKDRLIKMLLPKMNAMNIKAKQVQGDADFDIVMAAIEAAEQHRVIVFGEDTDLLILLLHHASVVSHPITFRPFTIASPKTRIWNITAAKLALGDSICLHLLFVHAFSGCDTTSNFFSHGKTVALRVYEKDERFKEAAAIFTLRDQTPAIIQASGETAAIALYGGATTVTSVNDLRQLQFHQRMASARSFVHPRQLPPTASAIKFHALRVYYQVINTSPYIMN